MPQTFLPNVSDVRNETTDATKPMIKSKVDGFHGGAFEVYQPTGEGHRSGLDALLLAASMREDACGVLADLGAGVGVAGFAALNLNPNLQLLSVELNEAMHELAHQSLDLTSNTHIRDRIHLLQADVMKTGFERVEQGLDNNCADHVIMNPPYNTTGMRAPENAIRAEAYVMGDGGLDAWFRTAAAILKPGGSFCVIYRTENLASVLACSQGRFGGLEVLPIHSKPGEAAKRVLVRGIRGSRAPLTITPGLVVHDEEGNSTAHAKRIFMGEDRLRF